MNDNSHSLVIPMAVTIMGLLVVAFITFNVGMDMGRAQNNAAKIRYADEFSYRLDRCVPHDPNFKPGFDTPDRAPVAILGRNLLAEAVETSSLETNPYRYQLTIADNPQSNPDWYYKLAIFVGCRCFVSVDLKDSGNVVHLQCCERDKKTDYTNAVKDYRTEATNAKKDKDNTGTH